MKLRKVTAIEEKVLALAVEWAKWDHERLRQRGFGNTGCYENSRAIQTNTNLQKAAKRLLKQRAKGEKK